MSLKWSRVRTLLHTTLLSLRGQGACSDSYSIRCVGGGWEPQRLRRHRSNQGPEDSQVKNIGLQSSLNVNSTNWFQSQPSLGFVICPPEPTDWLPISRGRKWKGPAPGGFKEEEVPDKRINHRALMRTTGEKVFLVPMKVVTRL